MQKILLLILVTALIISTVDAWRLRRALRRVGDSIRRKIARIVKPPDYPFRFPYPTYPVRFKRDDDMNDIDLEEMKRDEEELAEVERYLTEEFDEREVNPEENEEMKRFLESQKGLEA